jgi:methyltransferase (TIGR00027 family)
MAWRPLRNLMMRSLDKQTPGLWGGMVARKRYADDRVDEALAEGIKQFVILGAGFDTRAFRLIAPAGADAFEVDLPDNSARKKASLQRVLGNVPPHVTLAAVDFESDDLEDSLVAQGFRPELPAMYVMEAVTQYLTPEAVGRLFTVLSNAAASSRLEFTYVRRDFLEGKELYGWDKVHEQWVVKDNYWRWGLYPDDVDEFLERYGWDVRDHVGADDYRVRYFEPAGRDLSAIDVERFVSAEKL